MNKVSDYVVPFMSHLAPVPRQRGAVMQPAGRAPTPSSSAGHRIGVPGCSSHCPAPPPWPQRREPAPACPVCCLVLVACEERWGIDLGSGWGDSKLTTRVLCAPHSLVCNGIGQLLALLVSLPHQHLPRAQDLLARLGHVFKDGTPVVAVCVSRAIQHRPRRRKGGHSLFAQLMLAVLQRCLCVCELLQLGL